MLFDWATEIQFGPVNGALRARIKNTVTGTVLYADNATGVTDASVIAGNGVYNVQCTAAAGRQLDSTWGAGIQLILRDDSSELHYDLDPILAAERNKSINVGSFLNYPVTVDHSGRLNVAIVGAAGSDIDQIGGLNFCTFFQNDSQIAGKLLSDIGAGGGGSGGTGTGTGNVAVNQDTGGIDSMRYITAGGAGIDDAEIIAYLKSEYDAGTRVGRGTTFTGPDGRWVKPLMLNSGFTYYLIFKGANYGPDIATRAVA
jgi:hypothetical protein